MDKDELLKYAGNKLRKIRLQKNMTQEILAEKLETTKQSVGRYENGSRGMNQDLLFQLSDIFSVPISYFFPPTESKSLITIYEQLTPQRQTKVYDFASYQLKEQNRKPTITIKICGYVSAGTGEWLEETSEEVEFSGDIPQHDFAVRVNGDSMLPLFEDKQVIFVNSSSEARDGQIIVCRVNSDAYVKKLSGNKLVSLNKEYDDILISDTDDFKIFGVVVL